MNILDDKIITFVKDKLIDGGVTDTEAEILINYIFAGVKNNVIESLIKPIVVEYGDDEDKKEFEVSFKESKDLFTLIEKVASIVVEKYTHDNQTNKEI